MKKKYKVLMLAEHFMTGGVERLLQEITAAKSAEFDFEFLAIGKKGGFARKYEKAGFKVGSAGVKRGIVPFIFSLRRLVKTIKNISPDIIHSHLWLGNFAARYTGKKLGIPVIATEHNIHSGYRFYHRLIDGIYAGAPGYLVAVS